MKRWIVLSFLSLAACCGSLHAETVFLQATQDNTLYESPSGRLSNGAGQHMFAGLTIDLTRRRAVFAFKDLGSIPAGATVTSVRLHLNLSLENAQPRTYRLHRVTRDWGEGDSRASGTEALGANSETNDATWAHRFWPNITWQTPGGDFEEDASAELDIGPVGSYTFGPTVGLIEDVQSWVDDPARNFGWILIGEENIFSERRFDTRENDTAANRPVLEVEFTSTGTPFDYSGPWFDPSLDGEGYLVYQTPAGWLVYYFGYSSDQNFMWLVSDLVKLDELVRGEPFGMNLFIGTPGTFEQPTPSSELTAYGTLSVRFDSCTTGVFVIDGPDGLKTSNVVKIVGVDGTVCQ